MHRTNPISFVAYWGLLVALGLGTLASRSLAQAPAVAPPEGEKILRIPVEQSRLVSHASKLEIKDFYSPQPDIVKVELPKNEPFFARLIGVKPGYSEVILTDVKGNKDKINVHVIDLEDELFQVEKRKLDARRDLLLSLIRKAVPTANVEVVLGLQRNKVSNENVILTGSIVLTGTVFEVESIQTIMDLANAVFAGSAQPGRRGAPASAQPLPGQPNAPGPFGAPAPAASTIITPQAIPGYNQTGGVNVPAGNQITVINNLRLVGGQQVELGVVVAVVNRTAARNMGFNWFDNQTSSFVTSFFSPVSTVTSIAAAVAGASASGSATPGNVSFGILKGNNGFNGVLQALRTENLVKIMAEPRVVTLSGRPANFIDGGQIPIISSSSAGSNVSFVQFGTVLNFVPIVLGNGKIHLEVAASVSQPNSQVGVSIASAGSVASAPGLTTRGAQVAVQMEDGQTLAIGGLIQNTVNSQTQKVPVLGDLPFLGVAFRTVSYTESEEELVILVTPRLIEPMACTQLSKYLPGRETRVADDFELFIEGIMEAPRGQRTVSLRPHEYVPAHRLPGANSAYPCGPFGCASGTGGAQDGSCLSGNCSNGVSAPSVPSFVPTSMPAEQPVTSPALLPAPTSSNAVPQDSASPQPGFADVQLPGVVPAGSSTQPNWNVSRPLELPSPTLGVAVPQQ